ncbi:MAG: 3-phosphoshikimate 1-carboxyvinyltransferase [Hyphomicrobiaceae bacterium]|nr:3-phosphoshikimate 1-carboxyvinyltransferase [Hyphomicrobiaceae bacterium]
MGEKTARVTQAHGSAPLSGTVALPGDKSISHRALILGALASGRTHISGLLRSQDVMATAQALRDMGAQIEPDGEDWLVTGCGVGGLRQPGNDLDFGNSGTAVRLMMGVIGGHDLSARLIGDRSLSSRPMGRVLIPLKLMGLQVVGEQSDMLPLSLRGSSDLVPIRYELPVASAQVKSAIMLAGLHAPGQTIIIEPKPTRDHSERMMRHFGADIAVKELDGGGREITVNGHAELVGCEVIVPGDPSSAAFMVAGALIVPGSELLVKNVLVNPTRTGFYSTLQEMGADLQFENERDAAGEPVADIRVKHGPLKGVVVPPERAPSMIDEYPVLAALAAYASGETRMEGLEELRVKESDRLMATKTGLDQAGVVSHIDGDALVVQGCGGNDRVPGGGLVATHMDHRIAMSFLILGLGSEQPMSVDDVSIIDTSFPGFLDLMNDLGARMGTAA